jgi:hypothetical protein
MWNGWFVGVSKRGSDGRRRTEFTMLQSGISTRPSLLFGPPLAKADKLTFGLKSR